MPDTVAFTRSSSDGLATFANMPQAASILLFTPVLTPARVEGASNWKDTDPFESFGRALSTYHKRIRHVPFLPKIGYTDTHSAFVSQSDAIIIVLCEPEDDGDHRVSHQIAFALHALEAAQGKEANAANTLILVQCAGEEQRMIANAAFRNVIEVSSYDNEIAKQLARAIFETQKSGIRSMPLTA